MALTKSPKNSTDKNTSPFLTSLLASSHQNTEVQPKKKPVWTFLNQIFTIFFIWKLFVIIITDSLTSTP